MQPDALDKSIFFKRRRHAAEILLPADDHRRPAHQRLQLRRDDGRHGEGALPGHRGEPDRYRAYDYAVGSQNPSTGGDNNTDTPVLVYKILSHFDIKREYNPGTGEETNVISENEKDRPWSQRQYMRVDWSQNFADPQTGRMRPSSCSASPAISAPGSRSPRPTIR